MYLHPPHTFLQESGPLDSEAMVMGVLDQSFDVLVLRYGVQKRIYCKVSSNNVFYNVIFFFSSKIPIYSQVLIFYFLVIIMLLIVYNFQFFAVFTMPLLNIHISLGERNETVKWETE